MRFRETAIPGVFIVELEQLTDARGFFARTWSAVEFAANGLDSRIAECSVSFNQRALTLRGMHFQAAPHEEAKLVRCTQGSIFDAILDLRPESPGYKRWIGVELPAGTGRMVYIPPGCAHGFLTLAANTEVTYQISTPHRPESARGVRWNDPAFNIQWPASPQVMSERDRMYPDLT